MHSTLTPKPSDDPHDVVVVAPDAVGVAPADEELANLLHQAARHRSDPQTGATADLPAGPIVPPVDATFRPAAVNDVAVVADRSSMARRAMRAFTALLLAACIGVATFAWRAYGDTVEKKIAKWTTQLVLTVSLPPEKPGPVAPPTPPAVETDAANAAPSPPAAPVQTAAEAVAPTAAAPSADSAQLLQSMARDLASQGQEVEQLKASIEQLKAGQRQASRDVARLPEQPLRPRVAAPPPRPAVARARKPMPAYPPMQASAAPPLPPPAAPYYPPRQTDYVPRQIEPPSPAVESLTDPELTSVPRPPMPLR